MAQAVPAYLTQQVMVDGEPHPMTYLPEKLTITLNQFNCLFGLHISPPIPPIPPIWCYKVQDVPTLTTFIWFDGKHDLLNARGGSAGQMYKELINFQFLRTDFISTVSISLLNGTTHSSGFGATVNTTNVINNTSHQIMNLFNDLSNDYYNNYTSEGSKIFAPVFNNCREKIVNGQPVDSMTTITELTPDDLGVAQTFPVNVQNTCVNEIDVLLPLPFPFEFGIKYKTHGTIGAMRNRFKQLFNPADGTLIPLNTGYSSTKMIHDQGGALRMSATKRAPLNYMFSNDMPMGDGNNIFSSDPNAVRAVPSYGINGKTMDAANPGNIVPTNYPYFPPTCSVYTKLYNYENQFVGVVYILTYFRDCTYGEAPIRTVTTTDVYFICVRYNDGVVLINKEQVDTWISGMQDTILDRLAISTVEQAPFPEIIQASTLITEYILGSQNDDPILAQVGDFGIGNLLNTCVFKINKSSIGISVKDIRIFVRYLFDTSTTERLLYILNNLFNLENDLYMQTEFIKNVTTANTNFLRKLARIFIAIYSFCGQGANIPRTTIQPTFATTISAMYREEQMSPFSHFMHNIFVGISRIKQKGDETRAYDAYLLQTIQSEPFLPNKTVVLGTKDMYLTYLLEQSCQSYYELSTSSKTVFIAPFSSEEQIHARPPIEEGVEDVEQAFKRRRTGIQEGGAGITPNLRVIYDKYIQLVMADVITPLTFPDVKATNELQFLETFQYYLSLLVVISTHYTTPQTTMLDTSNEFLRLMYTGQQTPQNSTFFMNELLMRHLLLHQGANIADTIEFINSLANDINTNNFVTLKIHSNIKSYFTHIITLFINCDFGFNGTAIFGESFAIFNNPELTVVNPEMMLIALRTLHLQFIESSTDDVFKSYFLDESDQIIFTESSDPITVLYAVIDCGAYDECVDQVQSTRSKIFADFIFSQQTDITLSYFDEVKQVEKIIDNLEYLVDIFEYLGGDITIITDTGVHVTESPYSLLLLVVKNSLLWIYGIVSNRDQFTRENYNIIIQLVGNIYKLTSDILTNQIQIGPIPESQLITQHALVAAPFAETPRVSGMIQPPVFGPTGLVSGGKRRNTRKNKNPKRKNKTNNKRKKSTTIKRVKIYRKRKRTRRQLK